MARKGQFKKGGGRVGDGRARSSRSRRTTTAIVVAAPRSPARRYTPRPKKARAHRRRRGGGGGGINLLHVGLATAGLAFVMGDKSPAPSIRSMAAKIPGAKTFGAAATVGLGALAADRFVKRNKWLRLLGVAGVVLAAAKVGAAGTDFKFVGDDDVMADLDDDIADVDDDIAGDEDLDE